MILRWREWWQDAVDWLRELGRSHLAGIAVEVGAVLLLVGAAGVLALLITGGRL